jgi:hypothetical protein
VSGQRGAYLPCAFSFRATTPWRRLRLG